MAGVCVEGGGGPSAMTIGVCLTQEWYAVSLDTTRELSWQVCVWRGGGGRLR